MLDLIHSFGNGPIFVHLPLVPIPFNNHKALLPLPTTPQVGFCLGLSHYVTIIEDAPKLAGAKVVPSPPGK